MAELPKKQFKSQSVNSLFRQQATGHADATNNLRKATRSPTPSTTKVKLLSRRKPLVTKKKSPTPPSEKLPGAIDSTSTIEPEPSSFTASTDDTTITTTTITTTTTTSTSTSEPSTTPTSTTSFTRTDPEPGNQELKESLRGSLLSEILPELSSSSAFSSASQTPQNSTRVNFNSQKNLDWVDGEWSDIQSHISTQTNSPQFSSRQTGGSGSHAERLTTQSPEGTRSWSSPNSRISSFRRGVATPMIHSLSQSPLSKPTDGPSLSSQESLINKFSLGGFTDRYTGRVPESRASTLGPAPPQYHHHQHQQHNHRHQHEQPYPHSNQEQWKSPTIWNAEERHLSTKSDSALTSSWSPFDIESLSLDDPFKIQSSHASLSYESTPQHQHQLQRQSTSNQNLQPSNRNGSQTSRFFPSPLVEQNPSFDQFPRQPSLVERASSVNFQSMTPPEFNLFQQPLVSYPAPQLTSPLYDDFGFQGKQLFQESVVFPSVNEHTKSTAPLPPPPPPPPHLDELNSSNVSNPSFFPSPPKELINSSQKLDHEVFPEGFQTDPSTLIPVSLYRPMSTPDDDEPYHPYHRRPVLYDQDPHPEGFASTFYKRGNNNFMFIRELQPKLVTSKYRDTVEVRVSFPSTKNGEYDGDDLGDNDCNGNQEDKDAMIQMRCHIVNIDVKELEGKIAGVKVFRSGNSSFSGRSRGGSRGGHHRGHGRR